MQHVISTCRKSDTIPSPSQQSMREIEVKAPLNAEHAKPKFAGLYTLAPLCLYFMCATAYDVQGSNEGITILSASSAEMPFFEDFESGTLGAYWTVSGTEDYLTQVTTNHGPFAGTHHLTMGDTRNGVLYSRNELTLTIDLNGYEHVELSFWARDYEDEPHGPPQIPFVEGADFDGVAISEDGFLWYEVQALRSEISETYSLFLVDLDAAIATYALSYNSTFRIRFNQYDNWLFPEDGIALDDIAVTANIPYEPTLIYFFAMDSDPGWDTEGQWAFGPPMGGGSHGLDPTSGYTGSNVYGYNLEGDYTNNMPRYWLTTPPLDCSAHSNVVLSFYRWLGVQSTEADHAEIQVSNNASTWSRIWTHTGDAMSETAWKEVNYDISDVAGGESTVYIRWGMGPTYSWGDTYPGWNIDDVRLEANPANTAIHYVNGYNSQPAFPYSCWSTAATHLQDAVDAASSGDLILVGDGIYTNETEIRVAKDIELRSVSGPSGTIVDGGDRTRCFHLGESACLLNGFTIREGNAVASADIGGGGVYCENEVPMVSNCVFFSNQAQGGGGMYGGTAYDCCFSSNGGGDRAGGGMAKGTAYDCIFSNNWATHGGGMGGGSAYNCTFIENGGETGGGMESGSAHNSVFLDNKTYYHGGGMRGGSAENCSFNSNIGEYRGGGMYGVSATLCSASNNLSYTGGGMYGGSANNCTITSNRSSTVGGGMYEGWAINSTFSDNFAGEDGGGMYYGTATNCILFYNHADLSGNDTYNVAARFSCASDLLPGMDGNITYAPLFVYPSTRDYRLLEWSPCINAGTNAADLTALDLDGLPRIVDFVVDMGAYEYQEILDADDDQMSDGYEIIYFGGKTNGAANADEDGDGQSNRDEYIAGMSPTDADSLFIITNCSAVAEGFLFEWPSMNGRRYHTFWSTNLSQPFQLLEADINYPCNSCIDTANTNGACFYRVDVQLLE